MCIRDSRTGGHHAAAFRCSLRADAHGRRGQYADSGVRRQTGALYDQRDGVPAYVRLVGRLAERGLGVDHLYGCLLYTSVLDKGTVVIGGITQESVQQAAELAIAMQAAGEPRAMPMDYEDVNVGAKVVKLIQSYTPIVNETVWLKR